MKQGIPSNVYKGIYFTLGKVNRSSSCRLMLILINCHVEFDDQRAIAEEVTNNVTYCPFTLEIYFHQKQSLSYKWNETRSIRSPYRFTSAQAAENAFRFTKSLDDTCVNITSSKTPCESCEDMQGLDGQFSFRPIAFYNKLNGESRVVKVYFDLTLSKICKRCKLA
jgi:hypothetical protein